MHSRTVCMLFRKTVWRSALSTRTRSCGQRWCVCEARASFLGVLVLTPCDNTRWCYTQDIEQDANQAAQEAISKIRSLDSNGELGVSLVRTHRAACRCLPPPEAWLDTLASRCSGLRVPPSLSRTRA